jgi:hypothetical protein
LVIYPGSSLLVFCLTQQHFVIEIVNFRHSESDSIWQHLFDSFPGLMSSACLGMLGIATNAKNVVSKTWRKLSPPPHFARNFLESYLHTCAVHLTQSGDHVWFHCATSWVGTAEHSLSIPISCSSIKCIPVSSEK